MLKQKLPFVLAAFLAVSGGGFLFYGQNQCKAMDARIVEHQKELSQLESEFSKAEKEVTESEVEMVKNNISTLGNKIADSQNQLATLKDGEARQAIFDELKGYFSDTLLQIQWYPSELVSNSAWVFESTFDCTTNEIPVIWTLSRPGDGALLSYVCGTYVVDSDEFRNMTVQKTYVGAEAMNPTGDAPKEEEGDSDGNPDETTPAPVGNDMRVPAQNPNDPSVKYNEEPGSGEQTGTDPVAQESIDSDIQGAVTEDDGRVVTGFVMNGGENS